MKRLDTRHPFLTQLAHYSRQPLAPVWLTVAATPPNVGGRRSGLDTAKFEPLLKEAILLPGINIYARPEDRPKDSMIALESEMPPKSERGRPPKLASDPVSVTRTRERRLLGTMPKTMHVLRHHRSMKAPFARCSANGCTSWQIEQAICNLRLVDHLAYRPRGASKRLAMVDQLRSEVVEFASIPFDVATLSEDAVLNQVSLDAAFLLRRLEPGHELPGDLQGRNARIQELGYA